MINTSVVRRWAKTCLLVSFTVFAAASCTQLAGGQPEPGLFDEPPPVQSTVPPHDPCAGTTTTEQELYDVDDSRVCDGLDWTPTRVRGWVRSGWTSSYSQTNTGSGLGSSVDFRHRQVVTQTWDWRTGRGTITGTLDEVRLEKQWGLRGGCMTKENTKDVVHVSETVPTRHRTIEVRGDPLQFSTLSVRVPGTQRSLTHHLTQRPRTPGTPGCATLHRRQWTAAEPTDVEAAAQTLGPGVVTAESDSSITVRGSRTWTAPYTPVTDGSFTVTYDVSWHLTVDKIT